VEFGHVGIAAIGKGKGNNVVILDATSLLGVVSAARGPSDATKVSKTDDPRSILISPLFKPSMAA
jgi:hypothetical protein